MNMQVDSSLKAAEALLGMAVRGVPLSSFGANSRVMAIDAGGNRFAMKIYPDWRMKSSERCRAEWHALSYLYESGVSAVPRPIAHDPDQAILILEWIDGETVGQIGNREIDEALEFLSRIFSLSRLSTAERFSMASEPCLSGEEIVRQINARRQAFDADPKLDRFLIQRFDPALTRAIAEAQEFAGFNSTVPVDLHSLIPADFGFHNALRERSGRIRFFDFDYFGWDDPVKLAADFILHPAMHIADEQARLFLDGMARLREHDTSFMQRYDAYSGLYTLRWALILLNVFRWDRQNLGAENCTEAQKSRQLEKAKAFVERATQKL